MKDNPERMETFKILCENFGFKIYVIGPAGSVEAKSQLVSGNGADYVIQI